MAVVKHVHHLAVVVDDLEAPLKFWRDALGLVPSEVKDVPAEQAQIAFFPVGDSEIELVRPTSGETGLGRYLEKRGPGMHHLCLEVDDIVGMLARLKEMGVQLINEEPRVSADGRKYAFIHPKSASGVMVELYELPG